MALDERDEGCLVSAAPALEQAPLVGLRLACQAERPGVHDKVRGLALASSSSRRSSSA
jgi:hypothetical protein